MTRIALIRHFPTDWNLEARLQGRTDRRLTDEARSKLAGLALPPDWADAEIVSSPLSRAAETATILAQGRRIRLDPRLVEISWGAWEGMRAADLMADPASGFRPTHEIGWTDKAPGGESAAEAWARAKPALARIVRDGRPAVLVCHKALMRVVLGMAWNWRHPEGGLPPIKRARLYPLTLRGDGQPAEPGEPVRLIPREVPPASDAMPREGRA
ncbi:histidine phosphatase family protein [Limibaculum sp. M0105]|uniref:Histidine phosphatase family protein n=1 Tax=Thermohalobaculum xanthum TaxID=2753746 RepID=A0A8J7SF37_9RHOB|nr:histidine phosphatase family protein [Thermohalobaculum xanthum]MBK0399312.1 histidine phosphatase family protein [Thermohalobaculum xanthum]